MGEVLDQRQRLRLVSISRLAELLSMDRKTVSRRLADALVRPAGTRDGYPVYDGRAACEACLIPSGVVLEPDATPTDPRLLKPLDRRAWYQSERERMAVESEARLLIPAIEVQGDYAETFRNLVQFLDTLGDQLERAVDMSPEQIDAMNKAIAKARKGLYTQLTQDVDGEAGGEGAESA